MLVRKLKINRGQGTFRTRYTPATATLTLTRYAPAVISSIDQLVIPTTAVISITRWPPTATGPAPQVVTPTTSALTVTRRVPTVSATAARLLIPAKLTLTITRYAPSALTIAPITSIQAAVNAAAPGATVNIPAGIYRESVTINKALTLVGAGIGQSIIDGRDTGGTPVRGNWVHVTANDVTVRGFTMRYTNTGYAGHYGVGGVSNANYVERFILEDCDLSFAYNNVRWVGNLDSTMRRCVVHDAKHLGVRVGAFIGEQPIGVLSNNARIEDCTFYHNNRIGEPDPDADGGNLKATFADDLVIDGCTSYDSDRGLWLDVVCRNAILSNNTIYDCDTMGIHDETSNGTTIFGNAIWGCGYGPWGSAWWGAAIGVASATGCEVYGNTVAWNRVGIAVSSQNRGDNAGSINHSVHDNTVVMEVPTGTYPRIGLYWVQDWASTMFTDANTGSDNQFWYGTGSTSDTITLPNRFQWNGAKNITTFAATPGGTGSTYISAAAKDAALSAAGIPATP